MLDKVKSYPDGRLWIQTVDVKIISLSTNMMCPHCKTINIDYNDNTDLELKMPVNQIDVFLRDVKRDSKNVQVRRHDIN